MCVCVCVRARTAYHRDELITSNQGNNERRTTLDGTPNARVPLCIKQPAAAAAAAAAGRNSRASQQPQ